MTKQYTLVLPIKIDSHGHDELDRFTQIQLASLNKFLDIPSVYEFLIICKKEEKNKIETALLQSSSRLPINMIVEDTLVSTQVIQNTSGWRLQQILKLAVAKIVKTPVYLILDTDCFLTKPFAYNDLFYQDKIIVDTESWTDHPEYWIQSAAIIDDVPFTELASNPTMGITPQILSTALVLELLEYLNHKIATVSWDQYLSTHKFTEFSLYWLFLLKTKQINKYQYLNGPSLLGNALWAIPWRWAKPRLSQKIKNAILPHRRKERSDEKAMLKAIIEQQVRTSFESNQFFYFSLIQSNIKEIPLTWIIEETNKYLLEK